MTTTKTASKYKTPILTKGGMHAVVSEYFAPSTGHTIEITRERGTPQYPTHRNTAVVRDSDGNFIRIPRYVRITQGSIAYHLFQLTPTIDPVEDAEDFKDGEDLMENVIKSAKFLIGSLEEQGLKPNGFGALKLAISNYESQQ